MTSKACVWLYVILALFEVGNKECLLLIMWYFVTPSGESLSLSLGQFHSMTPDTGRLFSSVLRDTSGLVDWIFFFFFFNDSGTLLLLHKEEEMCDAQQLGREKKDRWSLKLCPSLSCRPSLSLNKDNPMTFFFSIISASLALLSLTWCGNPVRLGFAFPPHQSYLLEGVY